MNALPSIADQEHVASFLAIERPELLRKSVEAQAKAIGVTLGDLTALYRSPDFRALLDQYTAMAVFNPEVRHQQYEVIKDISLYGEKDSDKLKAFDIASRQARVKVPERHEVDDRKSIEVAIRHLPGSEGGFVPDSPFQPPQGRKSRLGEKVQRNEQTEVKREVGGPFDSSFPTIEVEASTDHSED